MNVSDILNTLTAHGFDSSISDTEKLWAINDTVWDIDSREPWPYLEKTALLNMSTSSQPTNIPSDFKAVTWLQDILNGYALWPIRVDEARSAFTGGVEPTGTPQNFYIIGSKELRLFPNPNAASTGQFQLDYLAVQPALNAASVESDILLPQRYHRVIVMGAIARLSAMEDDEDIATYFQTQFENRIVQMTFDLTQKQYMRARRVFEITQDDTYENFPY